PMAMVINSDELIVAPANVAEAELVGRHKVRTASRLGELVAALTAECPWPVTPDPPAPAVGPAPADLADVRGQIFPRRALEISAAGGHHLLMVGPPGGGKTMLAERLPGLLGPLEDTAALRATVAHSAAGQPCPGGLVRTAPFRAPHHSSSLVSIIGGGSHSLRPGEITLASDGVLFLDELGEFPAAVLDALRQPLEQGRVRIARAHASADLPAAFLLVAATNPCPCGFAPAPTCRCTEANLARYGRRMSGPILDRLDLRVVVSPPTRAELFDLPPGESTAVVAARVIGARQRAHARGVVSNARLPTRRLDDLARFDPTGLRLVERAVDRGRLSGRGVNRIRAVSLTIDDLRGGDGRLDAEVVAEALALRVDLDFLHHVRGAA
ncbi:MAG TPA: ATP-binding protein, partial [Acidimicrobiales bacterium]